MRATNLKALDAWAEAALARQPCAASAETLRPAQRASEAVWLGIRRVAGIDLRAIGERLSLPVQEMFAEIVRAQERAGWIELAGASLRLAPEGLLMADRVGSDYLGVGLRR